MMVFTKGILGAFYLSMRLLSVAAAFSARSSSPSSDCRLAVGKLIQSRTPLTKLSVVSKESREGVAVDTLLVSSQSVTARSVAAHAILDDTKKRQSLPSLQRLESDPEFKSIDDQRDRSFARLLVTTVERRLGQIDKVLERCQKSTQRKVMRFLFLVVHMTHCSSLRIIDFIFVFCVFRIRE